MILYMVYEEYYSYGEYNGNIDVKYYVSKSLAEADFKERVGDDTYYPHLKMDVIRTED